MNRFFKILSLTPVFLICIWWHMTSPTPTWNATHIETQAPLDASEYTYSFFQDRHFYTYTRPFPYSRFISYPVEAFGKVDSSNRIFIDTSEKIAAKGCNFKLDPTEEYWAWQVYLINDSRQKIRIDYYYDEIPLFHEAKDENGEWHLIESITTPFGCTSGDPILSIPAQSFIVSKIPIYNGDFDTELRVVALMDGKTIYSNSYKGSIFLSQLIRQ